MFKNIAPLILASGSPRRREMLAQLGLVFTVLLSEVDERLRGSERPEVLVKRLAKDKAIAVAADNREAWVLSADTTVVINGRILGKPANVNEALVMLRGLAGKTHEVWTGFCLANHRANVLVDHAVRTIVHFADWQKDVFVAYANTGDPLDKAGGYGIQSAGGVLVKEISGSYSNVVGLPMAEVMSEMLRLGVAYPNPDKLEKVKTSITIPV